ncbi:hypothetical protein SeLEV6574_g06370 [Synchytrium endobioticum]|uniref:Uncharacterized protein n=1 Tax=Synchytrium endobioticum TaxID=286115 RepID=A0A507CNY8_9FUNG|nr:hypothetical protein SeLEV6574_g06370 [Synchytrium endobioticum]
MRHSIIVIILLYAVTAAFAPGIRMHGRSVWNLTPDVLDLIMNLIGLHHASVMLEIQLLNAPSSSASSISSNVIRSIVRDGDYPRLPNLDTVHTRISFEALTINTLPPPEYSVSEIEIIARFHELILVCIDRDKATLSAYYAWNGRNAELDPEIISRQVTLDVRRHYHETFAGLFRRAVDTPRTDLRIEFPPSLYGRPVNPSVMAPSSGGMDDAWSQNPFGSLPDTLAGSPVRDGSDMPLSPDSFGSTQMIDYTLDYR